MTTTVQQIAEAARKDSNANPTVFTTDDRELLERVERGQSGLFTKLARLNRYFYAQDQLRTSTSGAGSRSIDLSAITPPVERVLLVKRESDQVEINPVDLQDIEADLAPRYFPLGTLLKEVGSDWSPTSGTVQLRVWFAYRPAALNLDGTQTQLVSVPDRFASYLSWDLAAYFAQKDFGRSTVDNGEIERCRGFRDEVFGDIVLHLEQFAGVQSRRFDLPVPKSGENA